MIRSKVIKNYGIVGIDSSKGSSHVVVTSTTGAILMKVKCYAHNRSSLCQLVEKLNELKIKYEFSGFKFGFEPTGPYSRCIVEYLIKAGLEPIQVNPLHSNRLGVVLDNTRNKTDKKDPVVIAMILQMDRGISLRPREDRREQVRDLLHYRERTVKEKARVLNQLESTIAQLFPEYYNLMKGFHSKTSLMLLKNYQCDPQKIAKLRPACLGKKFKKVSCGRLGFERANGLIHAARHTLGLPGHFVFVMEINNLCNRLEGFIKNLDEIEKQIENQLIHFEEAEFLLSIKGLGVIGTASICCEIGGWSNYRNAAKVEKAIGLNLFERSSGTYTGQRKIGKMGNSNLRKLLYFLTLRTINKNGIFYTLYKHHLSKNMKKKQAIIAISRKLIRIMYAMIKNKQAFNPDSIELPKKQEIAA